MIIFGTRGRETNVGTGRFFCPACARQSTYSHHRVQRYFTLYFIPLIPMDVLGEYVECHSCSERFDAEILHVPQERLRQITRPWKCFHCGNVNSAANASCIACGGVRRDAPGTEQDALPVLAEAPPEGPTAPAPPASRAEPRPLGGGPAGNLDYKCPVCRRAMDISDWDGRSLLHCPSCNLSVRPLPPGGR